MSFPHLVQLVTLVGEENGTNVLELLPMWNGR